MQRLRKIHKYRARIPLVLQRRRAQHDLVDGQRVAQIHLNAHTVLQHAKANRVLAAYPLLPRIDPDIEVVIKQIVVGPKRPIRPAQHVIPRWLRNRLLVRPRTRLRRGNGRRWCFFARRLCGLGKQKGRRPQRNTQKSTQDKPKENRSHATILSPNAFVPASLATPRPRRYFRNPFVYLSKNFPCPPLTHGL